MARFRNLLRHPNGTFYVRVYVPKAIQDRADRTEYWISTKTNREHEAVPYALSLRIAADEVFDMVRDHESLSPSEVGHEIERVFERKRREIEREAGIRRGVAILRRRRLTAGDVVGDFGSKRITALTGHLQEFYDVTDTLLREKGARIDRDSPEYISLLKKMALTRAELDRTIERAARNLMFTEPANPEPHPVIVAERPKTPTASAGDHTFENAVKLYLKRRRAPKSAKTLAKYERNLDVWMEIFGKNTLVRAITRADIRAGLELLQRTPSRWRMFYPGLTIRDVASRKDERPRLSPGTVNAYLVALQGLFKWLKREGLAHIDTGDLAVSDPEPSKLKRLPFTIEDLCKLFGTPEYRGVQPEQGRKGGKRAKFEAHDYWLPVIALFSGMRLGEICGLRYEDFREENGIRFMDIRKAKSQAGIRRVPVHDVLIRLGLLSYVETMKPGQTLFPTTDVAFSKHFTRYRRVAGINDRKKTFHSFRHTVKDALRAARVVEAIQLELLGHAGEGNQVAKAYGTGSPLQVLAEDLNKVKYPGLRVPRFPKALFPS